MSSGPLLNDGADIRLKGRGSLELSQFLDVQLKDTRPELSLFLKLFKASPKPVKLT